MLSSGLWLAKLLQKKQKKLDGLIHSIGEHKHLFAEYESLQNYLPKVRVHHGLEALAVIQENTAFEL